MKDKKIKQTVKELKKACRQYLDYVTALNPCAYSDRMVEEILEKADKLNAIYYGKRGKKDDKTDTSSSG